MTVFLLLHGGITASGAHSGGFWLLIDLPEATRRGTRSTLPSMRRLNDILWWRRRPQVAREMTVLLVYYPVVVRRQCRNSPKAPEGKVLPFLAGACREVARRLGTLGCHFALHGTVCHQLIGFPQPGVRLLDDAPEVLLAIIFIVTITCVLALSSPPGRLF